MFTVLVKKADGTEDLYSADSVSKESNAFVMRGSNIGSGSSQGMIVISPWGSEMVCDWDRVIYDDADLMGLCRIFIMNANGSTVANYSFDKIKITYIPKEMAKPEPFLLKPNRNLPDIRRLKKYCPDEGFVYPVQPTLSIFDLCQSSEPFSDIHVSRTATIIYKGGFDFFIVELTSDDISEYFKFVVSNNEVSRWKHSLDGEKQFSSLGTDFYTLSIDKNTTTTLGEKNTLMKNRVEGDCLNLLIYVRYSLCLLSGELKLDVKTEVTASSWINSKAIAFGAEIYVA